MNFKSLLKKNRHLYDWGLCIRTLLIPNRFDHLRLLKKFDLLSLDETLKSLGSISSSPTFVKIGANDGVTADPCGRFFLQHRNWKGLLVEPVGYCMKNLKKIYSDHGRFIFQQCAIGREECTQPFYFLDENAKDVLVELPDWYDQLGSFSRSHITKHFSYSVENFIKEIMVEVVPLGTILKRCKISHVSFLHIDTEGFDYEVLKTLDFKETYPKAILIEHRHLSDCDLLGLIKLLKRNSYIVHDTGNDLLAISKIVFDCV